MKISLCLSLSLLFSVPACRSQVEPRILSALYGYDGCIGGVRGLQSEEDYLQDLSSRGCTVENNRTNVAARSSLMLACGDWRFWTLSWLDGIPVVFNFPLEERPAREALEVELSDGSVVSPVCVMLGPANERNELDTLLILGHFGDGRADTVRPARVTVVSDFSLRGPAGPLSALGLSYDNQDDFHYPTSTVRLTSAKLWSVETNPEDFPAPSWPLPSSVYPNHCGALYPSTSHVVRATFSGGVTTDGVSSVLPANTNIFSLASPQHGALTYLGLADLGQGQGEGEEMYQQDGDNNVDICLQLAQDDPLLSGDLLLSVRCDPDLPNSVLYPPKGKPAGCSPQQVTLTSDSLQQDIIMSWTV